MTLKPGWVDKWKTHSGSGTSSWNTTEGPVVHPKPLGTTRSGSSELVPVVLKGQAVTLEVLPTVEPKKKSRSHGISKRLKDLAERNNPPIPAREPSPLKLPPGNRGKKLTDEAVIYCRTQRGVFGIEKLAAEFNVSTSTMSNALRGLTFQHLNHLAKPWL